MQFLTRFVLKGYTGENKVDITNADFAFNDKNNLKWAGIVKENTQKLQQDASAIVEGQSNSEPSNILLYKTLFSSFRMQFKLLALKKLSEDPGNIPAQFHTKFKFYNFDWTSSPVLFFDPLAPVNS